MTVRSPFSALLIFFLVSHDRLMNFNENSVTLLPDFVSHLTIGEIMDLSNYVTS